MLKVLCRKLSFVGLSLFIVSGLIFFLVEIMPGDVAQLILSQYATPEALAALREKLGLTKPPHVRYLLWIGRILRGDFGESLYMSGVRIGPLVLRRALNSAVLCALALAGFVPLSLGLGTVAGLNEGKRLDSFITIFGLFALSLPEFVTGIFLIVVFSLVLHWFPPFSSIPPGTNLFKSVRYLILPTASVSLVMFGYVARMTRSSMITVLRSNYIRTAILKGLPKHYVIFKHALKNALLPSITVIGMNIGWLFGGLIVVESLFGYPGLGYLMVLALRSRDVPLIEATALFITLSYLLSNFATDLIYLILNPRIRYK